MKIAKFAAFILIFLAGIICIQCGSNSANSEFAEITYPFHQSVFPADIIAPGVTWSSSQENEILWNIVVSLSGTEIISAESTSENWRPTENEWELIKQKALGKEVEIRVQAKNKKNISDKISIHISEDKVEAPIFFRAVPLPFKFARENLKRVRWHLGSISEKQKPHVVLENIPVCANCHSFTPEGSTIAMDVDARDDKGAYAISAFNKETLFSADSIIHWSDSQNGKFTYGLLSQISPDGRYVVSTLEDCEIFADRKELEYSQLFFPFKGILVVYDRLEKTYVELEGANDTMYVHSNPCWTPDGKYIFFTKARAKHFEESGIHNGSVPKPENAEHYQKFEKSYMNRDSLMKFDIYKIAFNNGKGGKAIPVAGASQNGLSNYFPKISPDGKWMVFCQAESFMLLQKDSKLAIVSVDGGESHQLSCNTTNMNSWHSWSPNSKWLVFSSKEFSPYTQLFLTHINEDGTDSPPVFLENFVFDKYAANIPEFVNIEYDREIKIDPSFLSENDFLIRSGEIKVKEGNLDGAFADFNKAAEQFPKLSEPYYQRGRIYFEKGKHAEAIKDFNAAIRIDKIATYYTSRGIANMSLNAFDKAIADLNKSAELDPSSSTPWCYLGVLYTKNENYEKAIVHLEKAVELFNGDSYAYYYLGMANFYLNDWKAANDAFSNAIKLNPNNSIKHLVYELRARTLFYLGDYSGTINDARITSSFSPKDPDPLVLKGKAELKVGLKNDARKSFEQAIKLGSKEAETLIKQCS